MKKLLIPCAVIAYAAIAILTFGYSFNREFAADADTGYKASGAFLAAAVWPLYMSAVAFDPMRNTNNKDCP